VVLGDECFVGENAVLGPGVKVYPFKTVEAGAVVNSSIVWESRGARSLFGRTGWPGLANVDITPELATRVAMAYATTLKKGSTVVTSRDSSRSARMLKRAMMAGLNAAGRQRARPRGGVGAVTRFLRHPSATAASPSASSRATPVGGVRFFDDRRRRHHRGRPAQDRAAVPARGLPPGVPRRDRRHRFPPRALEHYTTALEATVDRRHPGAGFKLVVDYAYGSTAFVMPNVLAKLGADVLA
jgi:mannose-1-phosphate guanylyltransferase / phosphomannomutase